MRADEFTKARLEWLAAVARAPGLSGLAVRCAIELATSYVNRQQALETGELWAWPSQEALASTLAATRNGIKGAMDTLAAVGVVAIKAGRGRHVNNRYRLITPTPVGVFGTDNANGSGGFPARKCQRQRDENANSRPPKTPTPVGTNPVNEPCERNPAPRRQSGRDDLDVAVARILRALPAEPKERSNADAVAEALEEIAASVAPIHVAIAVERFCTKSRHAKEDNGRYMGAAHAWLLKRGWETYLPSADEIFLDGRPREFSVWLSRVRTAQRLSRWDKWNDGPPPGEPGCEVPDEVLAHCEAVDGPPPQKSPGRQSFC